MDVSQLQTIEAVLKFFVASTAVVSAILGFRARSKDNASPEHKAATELIQSTNLKAEAKAKVTKYLDDAQDKTTRLRRWLLGTAVASLVVFAIVLFAPLLLPASSSGLSRFLARHDPLLFSGAASGRYDIARVIADRVALETETDLNKAIDNAAVRFDLAAIGGGVVQHFDRSIESAVKRGVTVRVLLVDPGPLGDAYRQLLGNATGIKDVEGWKTQATSTTKTIQALQAKIAMDKRTYPGNIDVRFLSSPLFYAMWIVDAGQPSAVANVTCLSYLGPSRDWYYRISKDAEQLKTNLAEEFNCLWQRAQPAPSR